MSISTPNVHTEQGNAVALTLLGLSVAILAGVTVLYFIGKSSPQHINIPPSVTEEDIEKEEEVLVSNPREGWRTYTSTEYNFSFEYPDGWIVATGTLTTGDPAVSVAPAVEAGEATIYTLEENAVHVSVYPLGVAMGGIIDETKTNKQLKVSAQATISDYVLTSGSPWATKIMFESNPPSWNSAGFLFARVPIEEEEIIYKQGDEIISQYEFDQFSGDHIERKGFVDSAIRGIEEEILRSFLFEDVEKGEATSLEKSRFIVSSPERGEIIKSPLSVRGEVYGKWFFEGDLSVRLETVGGEVLAEVPVTPHGEQNEEEYTPFEVSLVFEDTTATSGQLLLGASGSFDVSKDASNAKSIFVVFDNL